MQNGQGQDAPRAGPCHPVKEVLGGDARGLLDGDEELDDDEALHAPSVQAEQVVVAVVGTAVGEKKVPLQPTFCGPASLSICERRKAPRGARVLLWFLFGGVGRSTVRKRINV